MTEKGHNRIGKREKLEYNSQIPSKLTERKRGVDGIGDSSSLSGSGDNVSLYFKASSDPVNTAGGVAVVLLRLLFYLWRAVLIVFEFRLPVMGVSVGKHFCIP